MFNTDDMFSDDTHEAKETPMSRVKDLIAELENIYMLLADECYDEAYDELECQIGTIQTILGEVRSD